MRILVVEDDKILGDAITQHFHKMGQGVDLAATGTMAQYILETQSYDLILLDLNLPKLNGDKILKNLREQQSNTPVLILTARDHIEDRIELLDMGADDYMTKPFDFGELDARCRALLRRSQGKAQDIIRFGNLELDQRACIVAIEGAAIKLRQREYRLLEVFMGHAGQVLSKEVLLDHLYSFNETPGPNVIEIYVARLRKSLNNSDVRIRTLRGLGYLLELKYD